MGPFNKMFCLFWVVFVVKPNIQKVEVVCLYQSLIILILIYVHNVKERVAVLEKNELQIMNSKTLHIIFQIRVGTKSITLQSLYMQRNGVNNVEYLTTNTFTHLECTYHLYDSFSFISTTSASIMLFYIQLLISLSER